MADLLVLTNTNTRCHDETVLENTGRFIMFTVITNTYNKKTKGPSLTELKTFFFITRDVRCLHHR